MNIVLIILIILLFSGAGYGRFNPGFATAGNGMGIVGIVLIVLLVVLLLRGGTI